MARAHALRNLAERFPQNQEETLSTAAERSLLLTLRREHAGALRRGRPANGSEFAAGPAGA